MTTPEQRAKAFEQWHDKHENRLILMDAVEIAETVWNAAWELATQATSTAAQVDTLKRIRDDIILDRQDAEYYKRIMLVHIKWCREALSAAPPQGESSEGWMPIETAPKDGTEIIVFHPAAGVCAAFCPQEGFAWHCMDGQNRFINNLGVSIPRMTSFIEPPTLWQPLPPPPSQKKATQEGDA